MAKGNRGHALRDWGMFRDWSGLETNIRFMAHWCAPAANPSLCMLLLSHMWNLVPELRVDQSFTPDQGSCQLQQSGFPGVLDSLSLSNCTKALFSPFPFNLLPDSFCPIQVVTCYLSDDRAAPSFNSSPVNNSQIQSILYSLKGVGPGHSHCYSQHSQNFILMVAPRDTFLPGTPLCVKPAVTWRETRNTFLIKKYIILSFFSHVFHLLIKG